MSVGTLFNYGNGTCPNPQHCFWSITEMPHTARLAAQIIALANYVLVAQQEVNCTSGIFSQLNKKQEGLHYLLTERMRDGFAVCCYQLTKPAPSGATNDASM